MEASISEERISHEKDSSLIVVPGRETATAVIPTFNVENIIARCLDELTWLDEVIIVDMFSTDKTREICESYPNVRFVERKDYIFGNVNYGFGLVRTDWMIRLDSDEIFSRELQESIQHVLRNPDPEVVYYAFPSIQYMFGMPMQHGVGLTRLNIKNSMFRRGAVSYNCKGEHEDLVPPPGKRVVLNGTWDHITNVTTEEVVRKINYYTERDVERLEPSELKPPRPWYLIYRAARMFVLYYFQWQGYKDGYLGFFSSLYRGPVYMFIEEAKRWQAWEKSRGNLPKT